MCISWTFYCQAYSHIAQYNVIFLQWKKNKEMNRVNRQKVEEEDAIVEISLETIAM